MAPKETSSGLRNTDLNYGKTLIYMTTFQTGSGGIFNKVIHAIFQDRSFKTDNYLRRELRLCKTCFSCMAIFVAHCKPHDSYTLDPGLYLRY